jgi:hypothetical protein
MLNIITGYIMDDIEQLLSRLDNIQEPIVEPPPWTVLDDYDEAHELYMKNLRPCLKMMDRYELVLDPEHYINEFQKAFVKHYIWYAKRTQDPYTHAEWLKNPKDVDENFNEVYTNNHYLQLLIY